MRGRRTSHYFRLKKRGEELWDSDQAFRKKVVAGGQSVADSEGIPAVFMSGERTLIVVYPRRAIPPQA